MRKLAAVVLTTSLVLTGCASTQNSLLGGVGMELFTQAVDNKCRSELNANNTYKLVAMLMSDTQKSALEDKVCGCVASEAPKSISMSEMGQAVMDSSARPQIVAKVVTHTLSTCVQNFVSGKEAGNK